MHFPYCSLFNFIIIIITFFLFFLFKWHISISVAFTQLGNYTESISMFDSIMYDMLVRAILTQITEAKISLALLKHAVLVQKYVYAFCCDTVKMVLSFSK